MWIMKKPQQVHCKQSQPCCCCCCCGVRSESRGKAAAECQSQVAGEQAGAVQAKSALLLLLLLWCRQQIVSSCLPVRLQVSKQRQIAHRRSWLSLQTCQWLPEERLRSPPQTWCHPRACLQCHEGQAAVQQAKKSAADGQPQAVLQAAAASSQQRARAAGSISSKQDATLQLCSPVPQMLHLHSTAAFAEAQQYYMHLRQGCAAAAAHCRCSSGGHSPG